MSSNYRPYPPQDQNSNASQSPWSASSQTGSNYESLTLAPIDPDPSYDDLFDFNNGDQYFDSLPRLQSPITYLPETSNSRDQAQQAPPSNPQARQQASRNSSRYRVSESPDPFGDFSEQGFHWQDSPRPLANLQSHNTTRASSVVDLTESSPQPDEMAPQTRSTPLKKRKAEAAAESKSVRPRLSSTPKTSRSTPDHKPKLEDVSVVDLSKIDDDDQYADFRAKQQAEAIKQQQQDEANKPVKLAEFECIICMEKPTDLTVTHCGHLFCAECLHQALYAGNGKKNCPVCRAAISTAGIEKGKGDQKKQPRNGVFAVEMKLMTAKKKGKQAIRSH